MPSKKSSRKSKKSKSSSIIDIDSKTEAVFSHKGYKVLNPLGHGAYGQVYKAVHLETKLFCAVKVMNLEMMSEQFKAKFLPREIKTLIDCQHDNIIKVWDVFRSNSRVYIFMEFAANGDISGYIRKNDGIKQTLAAHWFMQAAEGIHFLHETLLTSHRDIKLDNLLLDDNYIVKVTDFGFAKVSYVEKASKVLLSSTFCGTMPYNSPQLLERVPYNAFKSDVWAMGVVLFIMMNNKFPFHFKNRKLMIKEMHDYPNFIRSRCFSNAPKQYMELQEGTLNPNEKERITIRDITRNEWLIKMVGSN